MKFRSTALFAICFLSVIPKIASSQVSTIIHDSNRPKGESTIRGRAIYDDTEKPVRRAPVALLSSTTKMQRMTVTDSNGDFIFKNVAGGTYRVAVDFAGRTNGFPMGDVDRTAGVEISVNGTSPVDVKLRAIRGASIMGRVTYPDGEPVVGAQINVFRKANDRWSHVAIVASGAETDDRGIFRIYPLRAGEYAISAIEQSLVVEERDEGTIQTVENKSLNPYFYQDALNLKNAAIIQVEQGRETNDINITLTERATHELSGNVMVNEKPLPEAFLRLSPNDSGLSGPTLMRPYGRSTRADKDGNWSFKGIPDGSYMIELDPTWWSSTSEGSATDRFVATTKKVEVVGADMSGISINLVEGGRISGSVVVEGGKKLPREIEIATDTPSNQLHPYRSTTGETLDATGTFTRSGIEPGETIIRFEFGKGYFVKSVTWKGRDLLRQPVKIESGQEIRGIVVVLSTEVGSLRGKVVSSQTRKPLDQTYYLLMPTDEALWNTRQPSLSGVTDNSGGFKVEGPPGEYLMVVFAGGPGSIDSFETLKEIARKSPRVSLKKDVQEIAEIIVP